MLTDRVQKTLFPEPIKSIGFDQIDILQDIVTLYCPQGFECDPTYSIGNFYKSHIPQPRYKFDVKPQVPGVIQASADKLPLENESVNSINFDPPFLVKTGQGSIIKNRFGEFASIPELWQFYDNSLKEFARVLKASGVLVFKCQDTVLSGKNWMSHCEVYSQAIKNGFACLDLFILLAKQRVLGKHQTQVHARKYHSYFWVFQKQPLN